MKNVTQWREQKLENIEHSSKTYLRVTKHWFFNIIQTLSNNPSIGRAPNPLGSMRNYKFKELMSVFFRYPSDYLHWVPQGQNISEVLIEMFADPPWRCATNKNASWILHHDNASPQNAISVKRYLAKKNITVMEHPLYSPDLAQCDVSVPENRGCA